MVLHLHSDHRSTVTTIVFLIGLISESAVEFSWENDITTGE